MPRFTERRIAEAFARIEDELLASMMRNLERHRVEQVREGREWERWQLVQIRELERYTREHLRRQGPRFDELNRAIDAVIRDAYDLGLSAFERLRLRLARMGLRAVQGVRSLLGIPTERLDALVEATHVDMMRAEHAVLRRSRDIYRQVIFDAQAYATSGAATYEQAIDMATRDFLSRGIDGIVYGNGSRHGIREYSQMAVRTAAKRAALVAEGRQRQEWGVHTIFVNRRVDACPECMRWVGRVLVDDVFSGGTAEEAEAGGYALLSEAMAQGLFHPNCRDTAATYYPGITRLPPRPTEEEIAAAREREALEAREDAARQRGRRASRVARMALGKDVREEAREREDRYEAEAKRLGGERRAVSAELVPHPRRETALPDSEYVRDAYLPQAVWDRLGEIEGIRTYSQARDWFAARGVELDTDLAKLEGEYADVEVEAVRNTVQQLAAAHATYSELFGPGAMGRLRRIVLYAEDEDARMAYYFNQLGEDDPEAGTMKVRQWGNSNYQVFHEFAHVLQDSLSGDGEDALTFSERAVEGRLPDDFHAYAGSGDIAAERMADALGRAFGSGDATGAEFLRLLMGRQRPPEPS